jgi:hypothetical protein
MIVSVSHNDPRCKRVEFTIQACKDAQYGFRMACKMDGIEVMDIFGVSRDGLEQLESAIRAALIDSEMVDINAPVMPAKR